MCIQIFLGGGGAVDNVVKWYHAFIYSRKKGGIAIGIATEIPLEDECNFKSKSVM